MVDKKEVDELYTKLGLDPNKDYPVNNKLNKGTLYDGKDKNIKTRF